jgi:pyruvate kinase
LGQEFLLVRGERTENPRELVANYSRLIDELEIGKSIMLADGTVGMQVIERTSDAALLRVTQPGSIRSRQGINLPGVKVSLPAMSDADRAAATWAARAGVDFIGLSFVRAVADVEELKALVREHGSSARVVAKIEKQEALDCLADVVAASDGVMVARGDLGVEIDVAQMPLVQKQIVSLCNQMHKPVIIATQMLDSMQRASRPTRAEVTDVANAILDGCDACMLSGETAIGMFPREAVEMMNRIARATEPQYRVRPLAAVDGPIAGLQPITQGVILGAGHIAQKLDARLIAVASHSGATALGLSKQRNFVPTVGVSDREDVLRQMCLFWGVIPLAGAPVSSTEALLAHLETWGRRDGCLTAGDRVVLVAGTGLPGQGHNQILVHEIGA